MVILHPGLLCQLMAHLPHNTLAFSSQNKKTVMITTILIILNLFFIEVLLSIDNAAVLAVMVRHLPHQQSIKALRYGLLGAYLLRGLCLLVASYLVGLWWLKIAGGLYLVYLGTKGFMPVNKEKAASKTKYRSFWGTVIMVEMMDLVFSIDNIFAATAFSKNYWLILTGVFIGIAAIRFVSQAFIKLIQDYPVLEASAYIVIILLGIKLCYFSLFGEETEKISFIFSGATLFIFLVPLLMKRKRTAQL
jgi:YkoY family integral membrane protein